MAVGCSMAAMSFCCPQRRAWLDVDVKQPLQQLRPPHAPVPVPGRRVVAIARVCRCGRHRRRLRRNGTTALRSFAFGASTP